MNQIIQVQIQPPPGQVVAPDGFPANIQVSEAPQVFRDARDIRVKVFCEEQSCALERELDEDDPRSWSWVAYLPDPAQTGKQQPVSTLRIVPPPHDAHPNGHHDPTEEPYIKLTRVATVPTARGLGLSRQLLKHAFDYLASHPQMIARGWKGLVLTHAQVDVEGMYRKFGFTTDDKLGRWDEEGIQHLGMWKRLQVE